MVPTLRAQRQKDIASDDTLEITPRYSSMLFSISVTLATLVRFDRSLAAYLSQHEKFLQLHEVGEIPQRIAFLLYLLTYSNVPQKNDPLGSEPFRTSVCQQSDRIASRLESGDKLEEEFQAWRRNSQRFHKRLWAAVRDYLKEGCEFYRYFQCSLRENRLPILAERIAQDQDAILVGLEVPGDVWNLLFLKRIFSTDKKINPEQMRSWFDSLRKERRLPENAAVERFDVSFRYSPRMCDERRQQSCVFREDSDIWGYCPPRRDVPWSGQPCPVTDHLCGIEYACEPNACPVRQAKPMNLCRGCRVDIRERTVAS